MPESKRSLWSTGTGSLGCGLDILIMLLRAPDNSPHDHVPSHLEANYYCQPCSDDMHKKCQSSGVSTLLLEGNLS